MLADVREPELRAAHAALGGKSGRFVTGTTFVVDGGLNA
jgi:hypothetical protein